MHINRAPLTTLVSITPASSLLFSCQGIVCRVLVNRRRCDGVLHILQYTACGVFHVLLIIQVAEVAPQHSHYAKALRQWLKGAMHYHQGRARWSLSNPGHPQVHMSTPIGMHTCALVYDSYDSGFMASAPWLNMSGCHTSLLTLSANPWFLLPGVLSTVRGTHLPKREMV